MIVDHIRSLVEKTGGRLIIDWDEECLVINFNDLRTGSIKWMRIQKNDLECAKCGADYIFEINLALLVREIIDKEKKDVQ